MATLPMGKIGKVTAIYDRNMMIAVASNPEFINNTRLLYLADPEGDTDFLRQYNFIFADPLIPKYNTLEKIINDDIAGFNAEYQQYLRTPEALMFITTIITAIYKGFDVILYFPADTLELQYPQALLNYLAINYGIYPETQRSPFSLDINFKSLHADMMYLNNIISVQEYLYLNDTLKDQNAIAKMIMDLKLPFPPTNIWNSPEHDPDKLFKFISNFRKSIISTGNLEMAIPFTMEGMFKR